MRDVTLTEWQKRTLTVICDFLTRQRMAFGETEGYADAWSVKVRQNGHGEVRIEYDQLVAGQQSRFAVYISPAGMSEWTLRAKGGAREARWRVNRELPPEEYRGLEAERGR